MNFFTTAIQPYLPKVRVHLPAFRGVTYALASAYRSTGLVRFIAIVMLCSQTTTAQTPWELSAGFYGMAAVGAMVENDGERLVGTAIHNGDALTYEVVNGWAVHGGDMVLDRMDQIVSQRALRGRKESHASAGPMTNIARQGGLWPDGVIPYLIDDAFLGRQTQRVLEAINEWNSRTVITLVPRTEETAFVRFLPWGLNGGQDEPCRAMVGRAGGEQFIWLPRSCDVNSIIHEIGHAAGLGHEHQRIDRDRFVTVRRELRDNPWYQVDSIGGREAYDYASVMHYSYGFDTLPPGMITSNSAGLSSGDIHGIARIYGRPLTETTISTNPAGLQVVVDGESYKTPVTFDWSPGTTHHIRAPLVQTVGSNRFLFGRWNDDHKMPTQRSVMADPKHVWFEANYIVQHRFAVCAEPDDVGQVVLRPKSKDNYYTHGTVVELEAVSIAGSDHEFAHWYSSSGGVGRSRLSANVISGEVIWRQAHRAVFWEHPRFFINTNVEGDYLIHLNGDRKSVPMSFSTAEYGTSPVVSASELYDASSSAGTRFRFNGWSDGGGPQHRIDVPPQGGTLQLNLSPEHLLSLLDEDSLAVSPDPLDDDGYYATGLQVQVTAAERQGTLEFLGWLGDASGTDLSTSIVMDSPKTIRPIYSACQSLQPERVEEFVVTPLTVGGYLVYFGRRAYLPDGSFYSVSDESRVEYCFVVPPDAAEVEIRFRSFTPGAEVDLYVKKRPDTFSDDDFFFGKDGHWSSTREGLIESILITRSTIPPISHGLYIIGFGMPSNPPRVEAELSVHIRRDGIDEVSPRALAYVASMASDPTPQVIRLYHRTIGSSRYRIESDRSWLRVTPERVVRTGSGVSEVLVDVGSAGLEMGMHKGKLTVVKADEDEDWRHDKAELTGWEIPVFLSVASSHGAAALDQWSGLEVTSSPSNGEFYRAGERIALRVDLAVPIELSEDPTLALQIGNRIRQAVLSSTSVSVCSEGAKKESLYFLYEVIPQDLDPDGISIAADALTFGEGRIQPAGNVVPFENDTRHKVDGSIARSDDHGDSLSDATELVLGRPAGGEIEVPGDADVFRLELAAAAAVRVFTSGGLDTVGALESQSGGNLGLDDDGGEGNNFLIETALEAGAYYVRVEAYGDATGTYTLHANSVPDDHGDSRSDATELALGRPAGGEIEVPGDADVFRLELAAAAAVRVFTSGGLDTVGALESQSGGNLGLDDDGGEGNNFLIETALEAGAYYVRVEAYGDATGTYTVHANSVPDDQVDGTKAVHPAINGVHIQTRPQDGQAYGLGEVISVTVSFDRDIEVTGSPTLVLGLGQSARQVSLSGTSPYGLWFRYEVQAGDRDADGISILPGALALSGGGIRSAAGTDAQLDLGGHAIENHPEQRVDGSKVAPPSVNRVSIYSRPADGRFYGAGEVIDVSIWFSQHIEVNGSPTLALGVGQGLRHASFYGTSPSGLWFRYQVRAGDVDTDGISILPSALALNGGSIRGASGLDADLNIGGHAIENDPAHKVDGGT